MSNERFQAGNRELQSVPFDRSIPLKARVSIVLIDRLSEYRARIIRLGSIGALAIYLNTTLLSPFIGSLTSGVVNAIIAGAFTSWLLSKRRKMKAKNYETVCDLGLLSNNSPARLFNQEETV